MLPKVPKHNRVKPTRYINKAHVAWVAKQPCCICREGPCDAHHPITGDARLKFGKAHDWEVVPLCRISRAHHQELHDKIGNELKFTKIYNVSFREVAQTMVHYSPAMQGGKHNAIS